MKRCTSSSRSITKAIFAVIVIAASGSAFAQSVDEVLKADQKRISLAQASQERINKVVESTRDITDDYRAVNKEIDGLKVYNRLMKAQTDGQEATLDDIALSMEQVDVINRQIFPLMVRMIDGLERSIQLDIPFVLEERTNRIANLNETMARSDVSVAEKFRKVMEAYQIENDFGRTIEWYREEIEVPDQPGVVRDVNFLRVGRIGLYYQSDDGKETGFYNRDTKKLEPLGDENRNEIKKGLRIARQQVAPDLILVPIPAAVTAGGAS
jgi:uncharacterized protein (DUF885 family)